MLRGSSATVSNDELGRFTATHFPQHDRIVGHSIRATTSATGDSRDSAHYLRHRRVLRYDALISASIHEHSTAMRLSAHAARARLIEHDHGVLSTLHSERGVDAVPVVYVADENGHVGIPVDRVKPKASMRLQRERNLEADPRAALLIERWDRDDWSQLWWVKAELRWLGAEHDRYASLSGLLADRFAQYRDQPFSRVLGFEIVAVSGWTATPE